ncbi:MAG: DUF5684 domain-containing protein [Candidatus Paceibacteria bacterium]
MDNFLGLFPLLVSIVIYAYFAYCLMVIAQKTNTDNAWLAWIPIANIYIFVKAAGRPAWWFILMLIPIVNLFVMIILWMDIAGRLNKPKWVGILIIIPVVQLILPGYLAFGN